MSRPAGDRERMPEHLRRLGSLVLRSADTSEIAHDLVRSARELLGLPVARLFEREPASGALRALASSADAPEGGADLIVPAGCGAVGLAVAERVPISTTDVLADPRIQLTPELRALVEGTQFRAELALPLLVGERVLGALSVCRDTGGRFDPETIAVLQVLADYAALALDRARLREESERRRRGLEAMADLSELVSGSLDVGAVVGRILVIVRRVLSMPAVDVYGLDEDSGALAPLASSRGGPHEFGRNLLLEGTGACGLAVRERSTVCTPDVLEDPRVVLPADARERIARSPYRAILAAPMLRRGRVVGALVLGDRAGRVFTDDEIRLAEALAGHAALALENASLAAEAERVRQEAEVFGALAVRITTTLDLGTILEQVTEGAKELCAGDAARIVLRDPESGAMLFRHAAGTRFTAWEQVQVEPGHGCGGVVLATGRPFRTDDYIADPRIGATAEMLEIALKEGIVSQVVAPIRMGDRIEGLIYVSDRTPRSFGDRDEATLTRLADLAAIAITNARLFVLEQSVRVEAQGAFETMRESEQTIRDLCRITADPGRAFEERIVDLLVHGCRRFRMEIGLLCRVEGDLLEIVHAVAPDPAFRVGTAHALSDAFCAKTVRTGDLVAVEHAAASPEWRACPCHVSAGLEAYLGVPVHVGERLYGTLCFSSRAPRAAPFRPFETELLKLMAQWVGGAMGRRAERAALRESRDRLALLREIDRAILAADSPTKLARATLAHLRRIIPCARASVALFDFEAGTARLLAVATDAPTAVPEESTVPLAVYGDLDALETEAVRVMSDFPDVARAFASGRALLAEGIRSCTVVPLLREGELIGSLNLMSDGPVPFAETQVEIAREVAQSIAVGLGEARLREALEAAHDQLRALSRRLVEVQETERRRLARELHDEVGQILTALKLTLERAARPAKARRRRAAGAPDEPLAAARAIVGDLIAQVRDLSLDLRPAMLDDLGLVPALVWYLARYTKLTGIRVDFGQVGVEARRFPQEVETAAYRIVQEGLTNVARHARVGAAAVRLWAEDGRLNVQIEDRGAGFDPAKDAASGGLGLVGIRDRVLLLGGRLDVEAMPGTGVRITVELPGGAGRSAG